MTKKKVKKIKPTVKKVGLKLKQLLTDYFEELEYLCDDDSSLKSLYDAYLETGSACDGSCDDYDLGIEFGTNLEYADIYFNLDDRITYCKIVIEQLAKIYRDIEKYELRISK